MLAFVTGPPLDTQHLRATIHAAYHFTTHLRTPATEPVCWLLGIAYLPYMSFKAIQTPDGKGKTPVS